MTVVPKEDSVAAPGKLPFTRQADVAVYLARDDVAAAVGTREYFLQLEGRTCEALVLKHLDEPLDVGPQVRSFEPPGPCPSGV
jgi:hypothetical protein